MEIKRFSDFETEMTAKDGRFSEVSIVYIMDQSIIFNFVTCG